MCSKINKGHALKAFVADNGETDFVLRKFITKNIENGHYYVKTKTCAWEMFAISSNIDAIMWREELGGTRTSSFIRVGTGT